MPGDVQLNNNKSNGKSNTMLAPKKIFISTSCTTEKKNKFDRSKDGERKKEAEKTGISQKKNIKLMEILFLGTLMRYFYLNIFLLSCLVNFMLPSSPWRWPNKAVSFSSFFCEHSFQLSVRSTPVLF